MSFPRRVRRIAFALFLALIQGLMPALAHVAMARDAALAQVVCSPGGGKRNIIVNADGSTRELAPDQGSAGHCALCNSGAGAPAAAAPILPPFPATHTVPSAGRTWHTHGASRLTPPATGPPASS